MNTYNITATYSSTTPDPIPDFESSTSASCRTSSLSVPAGTSIDLDSALRRLRTILRPIDHNLHAAGVISATTQPTGSVTFYSNGKALGSGGTLFQKARPRSPPQRLRRVRRPIRIYAVYNGSLVSQNGRHVFDPARDAVNAAPTTVTLTDSRSNPSATRFRTVPRRHAADGTGGCLGHAGDTRGHRGVPPTTESRLGRPHWRVGRRRSMSCLTHDIDFVAANESFNDSVMQARVRAHFQFHFPRTNSPINVTMLPFTAATTTWRWRNPAEFTTFGQSAVMFTAATVRQRCQIRPRPRGPVVTFEERFDLGHRDRGTQSAQRAVAKLHHEHACGQFLHDFSLVFGVRGSIIGSELSESAFASAFCWISSPSASSLGLPLGESRGHLRLP